VIDLAKLNEILERTRTCFHPAKTILFRSYAGGNPTKERDVDLVIVAATDLPANYTDS